MAETGAVSIGKSKSTVAESSLSSTFIPSVVHPLPAGANVLNDILSQRSLAPDDGPIPLSFPAILRNPKLADRFAHLQERPVVVPKTTISKARRNEHEGKRWIRRRENAKFVHNPHITLPSRNDYAVPIPSKPPTFPTPLPRYLPRSSVLPPSIPSTRDPGTAAAGLFSLSLKGARRALRTRPSARDIIGGIEGHLCTWLEGETYPGEDEGMVFPGMKVGGREDVREVSRMPGSLVWVVGNETDGAFERYVVHCLARWYGVVSFSKEIDGRRLTYLLRPRTTMFTLDTPPPTDTSQVDTESDFLSEIQTSDIESDFMSDVEHNDRGGRLSVISEAPPTTWSGIDETNLELDEGFAASIESLSLEDARTAGIRRSGGVYRSTRPRFSAWNEGRSESSPSRSPVRRGSGIRRQRKKKTEKGTFYNYLFD